MMAKDAESRELLGQNSIEMRENDCWVVKSEMLGAADTEPLGL